MRRNLVRSGYYAVAKYMIVSPFKVRPIATLIRRKSYPEVIAFLENMPYKGARILRKIVKSAASNALNKNRQLEEDMLYVRGILIDEGPRMKRVWFRARGRADMLLKRLCHITVIIDEIGTSGGTDKKDRDYTGKVGK